MPAFASVDDVITRLRAHAYVCDRRIATAVFLADRLEKPILVEGPAGVGKTELAKALAEAPRPQLIRLQCYEGLDEAKALYEWEYAKQLLYTQLLRDKIGEVIAGAHDARRGRRPDRRRRRTRSSRERFLLPRPLLQRHRARRSRCVLLIDEIDKADPEFEAFLLEVLSDFQVTVPELGTIKAKHMPARGAHVEQRARAVRRAQAPLPAPVHRLSRRRRASSRSSAARARGRRAALAEAVVRVVQRVRKLDLQEAPVDLARRSTGRARWRS